MKKAFILLAVLACCSPAKHIPQQIIDSVVEVEESSGIVVYSDYTTALVLTAYHVVADKYERHNCSDCPWNILVTTEHGERTPKPHTVYDDAWLVNDVQVDVANDLALLQLNEVNKVLDFSVLARAEPELGEDIWVGANPNYNNKTLTKGIVSSTTRMSKDDSRWYYQVSGGIIYGSSGGGVFNMAGGLIGIAVSVDTYGTSFCKPATLLGQVCVQVPLTYLGYCTPLPTIKQFLSTTPYSTYFN
jgi:S1-C subfamily serine protease